MGFEFGSVAHLDVQVTLISFVCVIIFIVVFDAVTGIMEYFLEGSKLYSKMIQTIYKELMLMGLVSFIVVITEGAQTTDVSNSLEGEEWFHAVDFSHILLFFVTGFFVVHSFYLMRASIISGRHYKFMFGEPTSELIECVEEVYKSPFQKFLYEFDFLPLSYVRERVEFRLTHVLFRDAYCLPEDFHFAYYLSGCFDRYALKTTNRSLVTWGILIILAILNFVRIAMDIGFSSCAGTDPLILYYNQTSNTSFLTGGRRLAQEVSLESSSSSSSSSGLNGLTVGIVQREGVSGYDSNMCRTNLVKLFLVAGAVLCAYNLVIVYFSRLYKLRMLRKSGLKTTDDYLDFLRFLAEVEEKTKNSIANEEAHKRELRKRNRALKIDIEHVLDDDEASGEQEWKALAEALAKVYGDSRQMISNTILSIQLFFYTAWTGKGRENGGGILQQLQNVSDSALETEKDDPHQKGEEGEELRAGELTGAVGGMNHGPRKAMLHLHRSSTAKNNNAMGADPTRGTFFKQMATQVRNGKDEILKRLTVSKSSEPLPQQQQQQQPLASESLQSSSSGKGLSFPTSKVQPAPAMLEIPPITTIDAGKSPSTSGKTLLQRQRSAIINAHQPSPFKSPSSSPSPRITKGRTSMMPVHASGTGGIGATGKRKSGLIDHSVVAFLNSQLSKPTTVAPSPAHGPIPVTGISPNTTPTAPGGGRGPRRGSVMLQRINAAHVEEQNQTIITSTEAPSAELLAPNPVAENEQGLIQRYKIYRHEKKRNPTIITSPSPKKPASPVPPPPHNGSTLSSLQSRAISLFDQISGRFSQRSSSTSHHHLLHNGGGDGDGDVEAGESGGSGGAGGGGTAVMDKKSETEDDSFNAESLDDFTDIYLFRRPIWFFRSVELCIMFNCLYFAFWMTDFTVIAATIHQSSYWAVLTQLAMILPAFLVFPCVGAIVETCSMIGALSHLNLEVIHEVLVEAENTRLLMIDLRKKMLARIKALENTNKSVVDTVHELFDEIDEKKNGWIDRFHFRLLLRTLKLTFSDDRFNRLFRAVDSSGDGKIEWDELHELLFGHLDEKEPANNNNTNTAPHNDLNSSSSDPHHRDSVSSERFSVVEANSNYALRQALLQQLGTPNHATIVEGDADEEEESSEEEEDEENSDSEGESSRSAFSRRGSRFSNRSGKSNTRSSPRNSIVKPSAMLKQEEMKRSPKAAPGAPSSIESISMRDAIPPSSSSVPVNERKRVTILADQLSSSDGESDALPSQRAGKGPSSVSAVLPFVKEEEEAATHNPLPRSLPTATTPVAARQRSLLEEAQQESNDSMFSAISSETDEE